MKLLEGKVAIITGAGGGLGRAHALAFAAEGSHVAFCGRNATDAARMEGELAAKGVRVLAAIGDITEAAFAERFVAEAAEALAGIDILVNNVGGNAAGRKPFPEHTDAEWQRTFELNIFHAARVTRLVVPHMRQRGGGAVVTVSVQYLTRPVEVFRDVARVLRPGSPFIVTYSNRMFPTKAVRIWLALDDAERAGLIATYFKHAGAFGEPEMRDCTPRSAGYTDPLFAVWARALDHG